MPGYMNLRYLHIVVARDEMLDKYIVITAYEATTDIWEGDFKTKKKKRYSLKPVATQHPM